LAKTKTTVAVIGDVMLDEYVDGEVQRISPEAPVPVVEVRRQFCVPGGAANSAMNVSGLGASAHLFSVVGMDETCFLLKNMLKNDDLVIPLFVFDDSRMTTRKTRITCQGHQICRIDHETTEPLSDEIRVSLVGKIEESLQTPNLPNALLLSDYGKGVLTPESCRAIIELGQKHEIPVIVDPKGRDYTRYCGASLITPNRKEACDALKIDSHSKVTGEYLGEQLRDIFGFPNVLVTLGAEGMVLVRRQAPSIYLPAVAQEVFDVSGAGDTVAAVMALALGSACPLEEAVHLANTAAAVAVSKHGTHPVKDSELLQALEKRKGFWDKVAGIFQSKARSNHGETY
jgi:D-beta-D-heptose 7-phosphate kinase/D-beta-D-heptose 1-phosphate adenosyltransferase